MLARLGRIALLIGAILIVSSLVVENPPIYLGGAVEYPWQAAAMAKRACEDAEPSMRNEALPWRAWLSYNRLNSTYEWTAGFFLSDGACWTTINPRTGQRLEFRTAAID